MKKHIALVLLLVAAMLLGSIGSVGLAETQSTNVVIWAFADPHARYFEYIAEKYTELHPDVTFTVELMDLTALNDRLAIVIGGGGEGSPDLVDIEQGSFSRYMSQDMMHFVPLNGYLENDGLMDDVVIARLNLYAYDGSYYGLEHALCPVLMAYRPDLFEQYNLEVPATWEQYVAAARVFKENGIYITAESDLSNGITGIFNEMSIAMGEDFIRNSKGGFEITDGWKWWAEEYKALQRDGHVYLFEDTSDKYGAIAENIVATDFIADWAAGWLRDNVPEQSGMWRLAPLPLMNENSAPVSVNGGTGLCMVEYSQVPQDTLWDFMKFAMLDAGNLVTKYEMTSLYPPVYSAMEACNTPVEYYGGQNLGELWQSLADQTPVQYQSRVRAYFADLTKTEFYDWMEGSVTIDELADLLTEKVESYLAAE